MEFSKKVSRRSFIEPLPSELIENYPLELQLYETPPSFQVSFADFEKYAAERLAVLQTVDEVTQRGLKGDEARRTIVEEIRKQELRGFCKLITSTSCGSPEADLVMRKMDHVSHFVLRLAYCETEDKRRWFIGREVDLFKLRWRYMTQKSRLEFLLINKLNYETVSEKEKAEIVPLSNGIMLFDLEYYKVPFTLVSDLVKTRKILLVKGMAYISNEDIISVITTSYRSSLAHSLAFASRRIHSLYEDTRIYGIIKGAGKSQREVDYSAYLNKEKINIADLDAFSRISYPLCMQQLHQKLRSDHHLRHSARQQYGLFLKGIGVTLEDSLRFWRSEFTKKMDSEKFEKSYSYNIRHNYGKEGKRANYAPHNCMKIINESVGPGEAHGCPFKHSDAITLKKTLEKNGLPFTSVEEVANLAKKGHYQLACSLYFQRKHNSDQIIVNHPNQYFDESQNLIGSKADKQDEKPDSRKKFAPTVQTNKVNQPNIASKKRSSDLWEDMDIDFSSLDENTPT